MESWRIFGNFNHLNCLCKFISRGCCSSRCVLVVFSVVCYLCVSVVMCQALFPRVLHSFNVRIGEFKCYSIIFVHRNDGKQCFVRTWDENILLEICLDVRSSGQSVPLPGLNSLSCILGSVPGGRLLLSVEEVSPSLLRVLSDAGEDGHQFVLLPVIARPIRS